MRRLKPGPLACLAAVLLLLGGLCPHEARGGSGSDQDPAGASRGLVLVAGGLFVAGAGLVVAMVGTGPSGTEFDGRLERLPWIRAGREVELRLSDGSDLAGVFQAYYVQDDSLHAAACSAHFRACGLGPFPLAPGDPVEVPGRWVMGRPLRGTFVGFAGEQLLVEEPDGRRLRLDGARQQRLSNGAGLEFDPRPWLSAEPPAREQLRLSVAGESVEIGIERIERLKEPSTGAVGLAGAAVTAVGVGMIVAGAGAFTSGLGG